MAFTDHTGDQTTEDSLRRRLILLASVFALFAFFHFVDHAVRGQLVTDGGLNPAWNHSGWPLNTQSDKPYIYPISFVAVFGLVLGGMFFTLRGKLWAGYWLAVSIFLILLLLIVHFVGFSSGKAETPWVICHTYSNDASRVLAMIDLFGMFAILISLMYHAVITRQRSGRW